MARLKREIPCKHYVCKGECGLHGTAVHTKNCQICKAYEPRSRRNSANVKKKYRTKSYKRTKLRVREALNDYYKE